MAPFWITVQDALEIHALSLAEHGGPEGVRDAGSLAGAIDRPRNQHAYGTPDVADLAAAYAYGPARNHPIIDGNKRTSFSVCPVFLDLNGFDLPVDDKENTSVWNDLAAGFLQESALADWLRIRIRSSRRS